VPARQGRLEVGGRLKRAGWDQGGGIPLQKESEDSRLF